MHASFWSYLGDWVQARSPEPKEISHVRRSEVHTTATASGGGRDGRTSPADGTMFFDLVVPKKLGGPGGAGANPEKLFALGYAACFLSAMRTASARTKIKRPEGSTVTATVAIGPRSEGGFGITAALDVFCLICRRRRRRG